MSERWSWQDAVLLAFSGLGILTSATLAVVTLVAAGSAAGSAGEFGELTVAWVSSAFAAMAIIGLPAMVWGLRGLVGSGKPAAVPNRLWYATLAAFPFGVWLGHRIFQLNSAPVWLAPLAVIPAAGAPVLLSALLVRRAGPPLTARRAWGQFLAGLWVVPPLALAFEALLLVPTLLAAALALMASEEGMELVRHLSQSAPSLGPETLLQNLEGLLLNPWIAAIGLGYVAVIVPLIEEALKTVAVWPLLRRRLSRREAFIGGALSGAGYAFFEAFFLTQPGAEWTASMLGRTGATLMHTFGAGLVAWGLLETVRRKRAAPVLLTYALAVGVHGLWNASAVTIGAAQLANTLGGGLLTEQTLQLLSLAGLGVLALLSGLALLGLLALPTRLRAVDEALAGKERSD